MSKLTVLMCLMCFTASMLLSACNVQDNGQMLHYKRKIESISNNSPIRHKHSYGIIDLSDGQKVNFDAQIGPSFDIKY